MYKRLLLHCCFVFIFLSAEAQNKKIDTTVKMGDVGYRITCSNKKPENNSVSITPIGFKNFSNNLTFPVVGILKKVMIDDFNNDSYPDLFFYSFDDKDRAQAYGLASVNNTSCAPIYMPDIYNDPRLRDGYQGHDEFAAMGGFVIRKFPVYKTGDSTINVTTPIAQRVVEYKAKANASNPDNPTFKFEVFATHDVKQ